MAPTGGIPSLNYRDWAWIRKDDAGNVKDPYQLLPEISLGLSDEHLNAPPKRR